MSRATIVVCAEIPDERWRWLEDTLTDLAVRFEFARCIPKNAWEANRYFNLARLRGCFEAVRLAKRSRAKVLVTHGPTLAAWCSLFARTMRLKTRIVAHTFNFTMLPSPGKRLIFSLAFSKIDRFVVFSTMERELYSRIFRLPHNRFDVVRWSVRVPKVDDSDIPVEPGEYVSAVGGNARDYRTLVDAASRLPHIRFVLVVRPYSLQGLDLPPNVIVHTDVPLAKAMNVVFHSRFMVLPLLGSEVPCGHVTLVAAMHLGKAVVITDSSGIRDYVRDGYNALTVTAGSVDSLVLGINRLWEDATLCGLLGENGRHFAALECTEARMAEHFRGWLDSQGLARPLQLSLIEAT